MRFALLTSPTERRPQLSDRQLVRAVREDVNASKRSYEETSQGMCHILTLAEFQ